jgi:hypothetical protein
MRLRRTVDWMGSQAVVKFVMEGATTREIGRALKILDAAELQILDKAPELFTGPPPLNTNPSDLPNYSPEQGELNV